MRGAQPGLPDGTVLTRIIPADAGSTRRLWLIEGSVWDHPRGCGEHERREIGELPVKGSSPRMRGAQGSRAMTFCLRRIIPADAGSTIPEQRHPGQKGDHPRGCGEHSRACFLVALAWGSSPRMRGAPDMAFMNSDKRGIIPT